jgi:hypothetical protein
MLRIFHVDESRMFLGGDKFGAASASIELDEKASFQIGFLVRDNNATEVMSTDNKVTWKSSAHPDWNAEGHFTVHSVSDFFGAVAWNTKVGLDYANRTYSGKVTVDDGDMKQILMVDGHGAYGMGSTYW